MDWWMPNIQKMIGMIWSFSAWETDLSVDPRVGVGTGIDDFAILVNDLDERIKCQVSMFFDNAKIDGKIEDVEISGT